MTSSCNVLLPVSRVCSASFNHNAKSWRFQLNEKQSCTFKQNIEHTKYINGPRNFDLKYYLHMAIIVMPIAVFRTWLGISSYESRRPSLYKMSSYHNMDSYYKDNAVSRPSYLYDGNPRTWKCRLCIKTGPVSAVGLYYPFCFHKTVCRNTVSLFDITFRCERCYHVLVCWDTY